jgi:hypothetical protein
MPANGIANAADWRAASRRARASRAEKLTLPSGATILAARPEPLEWILAGRVPQRLLAAALGESQSHPHETGSRLPREAGQPRESGDPMLDSRLRGNDGLGGNDGGEAGVEMTREEVLELARFAAQLVEASVVEPAIGNGLEEMRLDEIPTEDRAFIFEWACRALGTSGASSAKEGTSSPPAGGLERFCAH